MKQYYLLCGFQSCDCVLNTEYAMTPEEAAIPKYLRSTLQNSKRDISYYTNCLGCSVAVIPYGEFEDDRHMYFDYDDSKTFYTSVYNTFLDDVKEMFNVLPKDIDWVMPMVGKNGTLDVTSRIVKLPWMVYGNNTEYLAMIMSSLAYQTANEIVNMMKRSVHNSEDSIFKFANEQIDLLDISDPALITMNGEEVRAFQEFYQGWSIYAIMNRALQYYNIKAGFAIHKLLK